MRVHSVQRFAVPVGAILFALALIAVSCGDGGNDNRPAPFPTITPATFQCSGPEGSPTTCHEGNICCGNQCISASDVCCEIPAGRPNAGNKFSCRNNQECCVTGCIQKGSPC